jgi:DNA helicase-2/ATP-dependent DNA helicase PcrA
VLTYAQFVQYFRQAILRFTLNPLNAEQDAAVRANPHPATFIVAGPGAGKTTVLALRVLKLVLVDGLRPTGIIATTFTRKAADELRSRILAWGYATIEVAHAASAGHPQLQEWLSQLDINGVSVGTLDSLSEEFITDNRPPGGITPATVEGFLSAAMMRRFGLFPQQRWQNQDLEGFLAPFVPSYPGPGPMPVKLNFALAFADRVRHDEIDLNAFGATGPGQTVLRDAITDYLAYLEANHFVDFAGLERLLLEFLQQNRLHRVTDSLQAVLVDEFQDTNALQERIYFELCARSGASLTVVGDDDQSIFRFRGATVELFANFQQRITNALGAGMNPQRVDLVQNYRSSARVVDFCNHFVQLDATYQLARVPNKQQLVASAPHAAVAHPPVLGMFRADCQTLANDLTQFLHNIFRGNGVQIQCALNEVYTIERGPGGDFGDAVFLSRSVQEFAKAQPGKPPRQRLPLLLRNNLESLQVPVPVFNPRGRSLDDILPVRRLLGLALLCIDSNGAALQAIVNMSPSYRAKILAWRADATTFANSNPAPGGLQQFIHHWQTRTLPPNSHMGAWPSEWPLLELFFTLLTWIPQLQMDPEGQVYLEAIARTVAEAGQFASFGARILHGTQWDQQSVSQAIRQVFENIASGNVEVDEEIMPYVPRSFFPIMTVHQAKGLEFPLVIVDVGSDYKRNSPAQRPMRFPETPDSIHLIENLVVPFCVIGPERTQRPGLDRAWDDLRRLYFVAFSRPENVLLMVGLTSQIGAAPRVRSVATGDLRNLPRALNMIPAQDWHSGLASDYVALI